MKRDHFVDQIVSFEPQTDHLIVATGVNYQDGQMLWEGWRLREQKGAFYSKEGSWEDALGCVWGCEFLAARSLAPECFRMMLSGTCSAFMSCAHLFFPSWCQKCKSRYSRNNRSVSPNVACYHPSSQHLLVALTTWRWNRMWTKVETNIPDFFHMSADSRGHFHYNLNGKMYI